MFIIIIIANYNPDVKNVYVYIYIFNEFGFNFSVTQVFR